MILEDGLEAMREDVIAVQGQRVTREEGLDRWEAGAWTGQE